MKQTKISKGYRFSVTSWENDGDNYQTRLLENLSYPDIEFLVKFVSLFTNHNKGDGIGNYIDDDDSWHNVYSVMIEFGEKIKFENSAYTLKEKLYILEDEKLENCYEEFITLLDLSSEYFYTRVVESYKVEYIPEDIYIDDVTDHFKEKFNDCN